MSANKDGFIKLWNFKNKTLIAELDLKDFKLNYACFFPENDKIIAGNKNGKLKVFDLNLTLS